ncbi:unnamed protein product [Vitrella brassicaformis CCMP3155]|uniref:ATP phosphoribosyltransferase n=1 Tax=Vitrella brassicaformis (strain CCMP3155) TaxID=1169540 RepID=A0A0G4H2T0_VITBC|nr:unnamed protein product [Vitrella brassicaformis CCMP3155]|eukprot:CEM37973.1 unnamed protein product [Vitrella brassicaformis CCMP3155]
MSSTSRDERCLLAVPKKGRLHERCMKLLQGCGLECERAERLDIAHCDNIPITLVFLPAADIPKFVGEGNVDIGITGQDVIREESVDVTQLLELGFGKCQLAVQAPKGQYASAADLIGKKIVTSFPNLTAQFFKELAASKGRTEDTTVVAVGGSVEVSCTMGLGDAVVDLVETGATMDAAGLEKLDVILRTQCVLIANKSCGHPAIVDRLKKRMQGFLDAQQYSMVSYNVHAANKAAAIAITPGRRSPNVTNLEEEGWFAISAMVKKSELMDVMDRLADCGAIDILAFDIRSCRGSAQSQ